MTKQFNSPYSLNGIRLLLLGFMTLFLELVLIRYLGANIWNMGYFPNLVLIGVFLGMGIGFSFHQFIRKERVDFFFQAAFFLLMILVLFVYYMHPSLPGIADKQQSLAGEVFFLYAPLQGEDTHLTPFLFTFLSTVAIFALISQRTARLFNEFKPLTSYTLDITGSCLGILAFMVMSYFRLPPIVWFAVLTVVFIGSLADSWKTRWLPLIPAIVIIAHSYVFDGKHLRYPDFKGDIDVIWSPYQRVEYINSPDLPENLRRTIWVSGIGHQRIGTPEELKEAIYNLPYQIRQTAGLPPPENVLIIGAGSGNDTTAALAWNSRHIDAVEIDPAIASIGIRHHPAKPYADPRVNLVINDGRAFMANTKKKYDIIIFAWADSIVRISSMSQLRLENYLFTVESMRRACELLSDTGTLHVFNSIPWPPIGRKMSAMLQQAAGYPPEVMKSPSGAFQFFKLDKSSISKGPAPVPIDIETPKDDWPFLHLLQRDIPPFYRHALIAMGLFLAVLLSVIHFSTRKLEGFGGREMNYIKPAFAFMGAAFMLLETKSVIQFSLLFGTTWLNNSLVFLGILILVLAANWTALVFKGRSLLPFLFLLLVLSTFLPFLFPLGNLLRIESMPVRFVLASLLTFSPIFFANLIFSIVFRDQAFPAHVFGWNLLGAMAGGALEYTSMILGYNLLAVIVTLCYLAAFICLSFASKAKEPASLKAV